MEGKLNAGDAHLAVNYENLLKYGLKGYEERTRLLQSQLDFTVPENIDKNVFYKSVLTVIDAVHAFALRYSALAKEMAEKENNETRRAELMEISEVCAIFPYEPAA